jgi:hypothetical protein
MRGRVRKPIFRTFFVVRVLEEPLIFLRRDRVDVPLVNDLLLRLSAQFVLLQDLRDLLLRRIV